MTEQKQPGWVLAVGIAGIIMSLLGIYTAGITLFAPKILEFQTGMLPEMMEQMAKNFPHEPGQESPFQAGNIKEMYSAMFSKLAGSKPWFNAWCMASGIVLLGIAAFYLFSSIMFLQLKKSGLILIYC
jgi:hypothetical protein